MRHSYDEEADAIYITLKSDPYAYGRGIDDERRIDYADNNQEIGIELLSVSQGVNLYGLPFVDNVARILKRYDISTYTLIPHESVISITGTTSVAFGILIGTETEEALDKYEQRTKIWELTGVS